MGWLDSVTHSMDVKLCKLREMVGFPGGASGREPACQCRKLRDAGLIPGLGRSPGGGHGNSLQSSCRENAHGQRSRAGFSPWGRKEPVTA